MNIFKGSQTEGRKTRSQKNMSCWISFLLHNKDHTMDGVSKLFFVTFSFSINPSYFKLIERKLSFFFALLQSSFHFQLKTRRRIGNLKSLNHIFSLRKSNVKCYIVLKLANLNHRPYIWTLFCSSSWIWSKCEWQ